MAAQATSIAKMLVMKGVKCLPEKVPNINSGKSHSLDLILDMQKAFLVKYRLAGGSACPLAYFTVYAVLERRKSAPFLTVTLASCHSLFFGAD